MISQFILALSFLVAVHELGHMLPALWFGMRVEKFYIGFPPKLFSFFRNGIEYGLGSIPLGGFVKISGMVDESLDTQNLNKEPESWEFRSKPAWQRLVVMLGGIIVNFVVGIIVFVFLLWIYGKSYVPLQELNKEGIYAYKIAEKIGFKTGDKIININGRELKSADEIVSPDVLLSDNAYYTVLRDGKQIKISIPSDFLDKLIDENGEFIAPAIPLVIDTVLPKSGAATAGLMKGDKVISVEQSQTPYFQDFQSALKNKENKKIELGVIRNQETLKVSVFVNNEGKIGIGPKVDFKKETETFSLGQSIVKGPKEAIDFLVANIKGFGKIFTGQLSPSKAVGGPVKIAQSFPTQWVWKVFWERVAMLSLMLAFMNLLPIPALDGGHVIFLLYELVTNRKPSDKIVEVAQRVGMALLLSLAILVTSKDILELFNK